MSEYDESSIKVLEGTEGVRLRPSMYIGDTAARGLHHLVYEVTDNSIDEAMAGRCSQVEVKIHPDNSISIEDDGRGIPAGVHPEYGVSTLEVILTKLHSGGKFESKAYQVSGGLHGVGLAVVCALSENFHVESYRDGKIYSQDYVAGKIVNQLEMPQSEPKTGTLIHFTPDKSIFTVTEFDYDTLAGRFKELAYLTEKFRIIFKDLRPYTNDKGEITESRGKEFYFEGGVRQFVIDLAGSKPLVVPDAPIFHVVSEIDDVVVEVGFVYTNSFQEILKGFVNNINTTEGGTHLSGFRTVLTRSLNDFARNFKVLKENEASLKGGDAREGITAIVSVKVPNPQFEGQTKTKLGNSEIDGIIQQALKDHLRDFFSTNSVMSKAVVNKAVLARRAREAAKKARDLIRKSSGSRVSLPGKLIASRERDPLKRELYLVEGQSAGGTAVEGRDAGFQEVLFLRGKVLNVEKARLNRALENKEIQNIITAIGTGILDEMDMEKCRYGKVILLTDADVDGAHIATLLFTFFYRYMKPLIESGRLYIARPPLYKVTFKAQAAKLKGTKYIYLTQDRDLEVILTGLDAMEIDRKLISINRFKGLGEMNADQLEETTMALATRRVERVSIDDAIKAEKWLVRLMGDDVENRKKFIQEVVFSETKVESRGPFYNNAFDLEEDEMETDLNDLTDDEKAIMEKELEMSLDEYEPEQEFLAALEKFEFS